MRKLIILALCVLACAGCGARKDDAKTITVWHWMTDREDAFQVLAERYKEQTGITVVVELYAPSDVYSHKIIAAAQARVLPDIYGILGEKKTFASFVNNGFVADLTVDFAADNGVWQKSLFEKALDTNRFAADNIYEVVPGIYGVPIDVTNIQMLYNIKLLKKAGINHPPKTFGEFLTTIQKLTRVGIAGLVSGWGEAWLINCFASNYAFNVMGEDKVMATYRGEVPYTDPDWITVLQVFETLADNGALYEGIVVKGNKYAEQDFALERTAFAFNGSWCVNVYHDMNADLEYATMLPPAINPKRPMKIWGAAGSSFVVNGRSEKKDTAIAFLRWLTAKEQQAYLAQETKNLPSNRYALSSIPRELADFARAMDMTTHPSLWKYNEDPVVAEVFAKGIQSIIIKDKTPQEVAREVQAAKERQMAKQKR